MLDIGLCAVTAGGSTSVDKCDLTPLVGRKCVLWRDNDTAGEKWQSELINALESLAIAHEVIDIAGVMLPSLFLRVKLRRFNALLMALSVQLKRTARSL